MSNVTSQLKTYTRKELNKMKIGQLDAIAEELGIEAFTDLGTDTPKKTVLIDAIIEKQDEEEKERLTKMAEGLMQDPIPDSILFRELSPEEAREFRLWARSNPRSTVASPELVHPIVRQEWAIMAVPSLESLKIAELEALAQDLNMPDTDWQTLESLGDDETRRLYIIQFVKSAVPMPDTQELDQQAPAATETPQPEVVAAPSVTLNDLQEGDVWAYAVSPKVKYTVKRRYTDEKERLHIVVTDKANKEMDLFGAKTLGHGIIIDEKQ